MTISANYISPDCIKYVSDWGSYTYYDLCHGQSTVTPWGLMDYIGQSLLVIFIACLVFICVGVALCIVAFFAAGVYDKADTWKRRRERDAKVLP